MNRIEIETKLNTDRAWLLERLSQMTEDELYAPRTLIERNFNDMFRRHIAGEQGMTLGRNNDGTQQSREEIMAGVHLWTEKWAEEQRGKPLDELVRIGAETRSETLKLLSELTQEQLDSKIPGAPWAD